MGAFQKELKGIKNEGSYSLKLGVEGELFSSGKKQITFYTSEVVASRGWLKPQPLPAFSYLSSLINTGFYHYSRLCLLESLKGIDITS